MRFAETPAAPVFVQEPLTRNGVDYPAGWLAANWANDRALVEALGIGAVVEADDAPEGFEITASVLRHGEQGFYIDATYEAVEPEPPAVPALAELLARVNIDRDIRIDSGFLFDGKLYQSRASDRENITRKGDRAEKVMLAATLAGGTALADLAGDLLWDVTTAGRPFAFKALDNSWTPMDAAKMVALRDAGEAFKQACTFIADAAKTAMIADGTDAGAKAVFDAIVWPPIEPA